ncbi:VTT domain-containing protein [Cellulomonas sp. P5_E12]
MMTTALSAAGPVVALGPDFLDPQHLIDSFGTWVLLGIMAIVFIEVGLLFPILPGDSLLFTAGALVAQDNLQIDITIWQLVVILILTAYAGTQTGYLIGRKLGPKVFSKPDSRFFKQKYIDETYAYFDKYGGRTLIVAQFIPFVRTYASVAAGVGKMPYRHFALFNAIGVVLWAGGVTMLGYLLGNIEFISKNIEVLLVLVVFISVVPVLIEVWRKRRREKAGLPADDGRDERYDEQSERDEVERKAFGA